MTRLRPLAGRLVLGAALCGSATMLSAASLPPPVPGAPMAAGPDAVAEGLQVSVDHFELQPVTAQELAGGNALPRSAPRLQAMPGGSGLRTNAGLQVAPLPATIERVLPAVWEYRRRLDPSASGPPNVRVELENVGGPDSSMSPRGGSPRLQLRPTHTSRRDGGDGTEVFAGGVILVIPVAVLQSPGRYRARLRVTVETI
jgi:hypothetical protein